jgi:hypothetical protein
MWKMRRAAIISQRAARRDGRPRRCHSGIDILDLPPKTLESNAFQRTATTCCRYGSALRAQPSPPAMLKVMLNARC